MARLPHSRHVWQWHVACVACVASQCAHLNSVFYECRLGLDVDVMRKEAYRRLQARLAAERLPPSPAVRPWHPPVVTGLPLVYSFMLRMISD